MTTKRFRPLKITDHFYQLGTRFFPMYLSIGNDAVLFEGGTGATAGIIIEQIKELGINPKKIKYIALTHTHADHIGAIHHLKQKWNHLKLCASEAASKNLQNEKEMEYFIWLDDWIAKKMISFGEITELPPVVTKYNFNIDLFINEGNVLDLGAGINWTVYSAPGHSPCALAYHESNDKILISGDASGLYNQHMDVFWPNYFDSLEKYCNTIHKLSGIRASRIALSHYGVIHQNADVFFKKALQATKDYHLELLKRIANGENPKDIVRDKANWIDSFVGHLPYIAMENGSMSLIRRSQREADKPNLFKGL